MSLTWLALALALLLAPVPSVPRQRARALAGTRTQATAGATARLSPQAHPVPHRPSWRWPGPGRGRSGRGPAVGAFAAATVVALAVVVVMAGPGPGVAIAAGAGTGALLVRVAARARAEREADAELLAAVRLLVADLRAGVAPAAALTALAEVGGRYGPVFARATGAAVGGAAVGRAAAAGGVAGVLATEPCLAALAHAWRVAERAGAPLADTLEGVAGDLEARARTRRAVAAAVAGPRASAALLAGLPVLGLALGAAMGAHPLAFLTGPGTGRAVGCAGLLLDVAGIAWTQRLVRRAQRP